MFVFGNVLIGLGQVLNLILNVYLLILVLFVVFPPLVTAPVAWMR